MDAEPQAEFRFGGNASDLLLKDHSVVDQYQNASLFTTYGILLISPP